MDDVIHFYQDQPHDCSYLDNHQAMNIYPDPNKPVTKALYNYLIQHGFRRSGDQSYRPHCPACQKCVAVRINLNHFIASKSQRRCMRRNQHFTTYEHEATFNQEHYDLYCRYLASRHREGGMDYPAPKSYSNFLISTWSETRFIEIRHQSQLIAVAVTDYVEEGLSAFYTFFDPDYAQHSLGTYCILKQIEIAKDRGMLWLYLGYWIEESQKMNYKQNFSGLEGYQDQQWKTLRT